MIEFIVVTENGKHYPRANNEKEVRELFSMRGLKIASLKINRKGVSAYNKEVHESGAGYDSLDNSFRKFR